MPIDLDLLERTWNDPYSPFFSHFDLSFWSGGLTLLAAAPGTGKTSWLLQMAAEAAYRNIPAALVCYEHTPDELFYRLVNQARAICWGPHDWGPEYEEEKFLNVLAPRTRVTLIQAHDNRDTVRAIRQTLIDDHAFTPGQPAFLAIDYLQRIPVLNATGLVREDIRSGEAAAALRELARETGWAVIAAAAVRSNAFTPTDDPEFHPDLSLLLGDERVAYEPDRIIYLQHKHSLPCQCCARLTAYVLKDRTAPLRAIPLLFWGGRFTIAKLDTTSGIATPVDEEKNFELPL